MPIDMGVPAGREDLTGERIASLVKDEGVKFLQLQFSDLPGTPKIITVDVGQIDSVLSSGVWFDGSSVVGYGTIAESDMLLRPDISTFAVIPWSPADRRAARLICNAHTIDGKPLDADPRNILKKAVDKAANLGLNLQAAGEFEFYLLKRDALPHLEPHDHK